jgi:HEAT repeat protein
MKRLRAWSPRRPSIPPRFPYRAILLAMRGHPSPESEQFLLAATHDFDPTYRSAAVGSLGWWEPFARPEVLLHLQDARFDPNLEVRLAARAALARLGERQALLWFKQALSSDNRQRVLEAIEAIPREGLTLLWPDLDKLSETEEPELAYHAREALERLQEDLDQRLGR